MRSTLTVVAAFALSVLLTWLFIRWVDGRSIVAEENHRSMHKGEVAVGGGLPLLVAAFLALASLWQWNDLLRVILPAAAVLALVSWVDDRQALHPIVRLAAHIAASAAGVLALPHEALVFQGVLPFVFDRLVAGLALVWFINLYNFMDGIDGLAGAETAAIAFGYAAINYAGATDVAALYGLALAVGGAALGFLIWNWSPARIFMGDVGSVPLGFLCGMMMLDLAVRHSLVAALILPLYFVADATITIARRLLAGAKPWDAHRTHFYQRAALALGRHAPVVVRIVICNAALMTAAVLAVTAPWLACVIAAGAVGLLLLSFERAAKLTNRKPD